MSLFWRKMLCLFKCVSNDNACQYIFYIFFPVEILFSKHANCTANQGMRCLSICAMFTRMVASIMSCVCSWLTTTFKYCLTINNFGISKIVQYNSAIKTTRNWDHSSILTNICYVYPLKRQTQLADGILKACFSYFSEEIMLDITCESSAKQTTHLMSSIISSEKSETKTYCRSALEFSFML